MSKQGWQGNQLDKDIVINGNKVYQPSSCVFVSALVNSILTDAGSIRGLYKIGVIYHKRTGFQARMSVNGKQQYLGVLKAKIKLIMLSWLLNLNMFTGLLKNKSNQ
jgi:hypothetical protein